MIQYLFEVSLCSIGFIAFYYLVLRGKNFHQWNRLFLNGSLVLSLLIPLLHIPITEIVYVAQTMTRATQVEGSAVASTPFPWQATLLGVYLMGCLFMLFRFATELIQIKRLISKSDKEKFPNYSLIKSEIEFPLCSFFNFIICEKNTNITEYELQHELTHIRQKHSYDKVFLELMKVFLWFNPVIYIYQRNIHAVHEFLADESVVQLNGKDSYQDYLIQSLRKNQIVLSTVNPFHSLIKDRLHMLNNKKESTKRIFLLALPMIACLVFFISCEKNTKVVAVEKDALSNLNFAANGNVILNDTIVVFNDETMEEEVKIVSTEVTPEEYQEMLEGGYLDYDEQESKNKIAKESNSQANLIRVVDTMVLFSDVTNEETIKLVVRQITEEEFEERKKLERTGYELYGRTGAGPPDSKGNRINDINIESDLITYVDTIVIFNSNTNQKEWYTLERQMTEEEYEKSKSFPFTLEDGKDDLVKIK